MRTYSQIVLRMRSMRCISIYIPYIYYIYDDDDNIPYTLISSSNDIYMIAIDLIEKGYNNSIRIKGNKKKKRKLKYMKVLT